MATLRVISFDMEIAASKVHGSRARQIAEMGIALGCHRSIKRSDPILRQMNEETGEGFEVKVMSEGGRFNINFILQNEDKALLREIFTKWGLELEDAQAISDALGDWVDADDNEALNGAEKKYYEEQGRINQPFNRPFYDLSEMRLVRGMDLVEAVKPDWRDWFTIWSQGPLDIAEASAELIAAAAEVRVEQAEIIPETVRGIDGIRDTNDDQQIEIEAALGMMGINSETRPDIAQRFSVQDDTMRVESTGYAEGAKRKVTLVIRGRTARPILLQRTVEIIP